MITSELSYKQIFFGNFSYIASGFININEKLTIIIMQCYIGKLEL